MKILSFEEKNSGISVFSLSFAYMRESPPKGRVFSLSFLLEFCPWVLVYSVGGVEKRAWLKAKARNRNKRIYKVEINIRVAGNRRDTFRVPVSVVGWCRLTFVEDDGLKGVGMARFDCLTSFLSFLVVCFKWPPCSPCHIQLGVQNKKIHAIS